MNPIGVAHLWCGTRPLEICKLATLHWAVLRLQLIVDTETADFSSGRCYAPLLGIACIRHQKFLSWLRPED
jgi:hypothetical protein